MIQHCSLRRKMCKSVKKMFSRSRFQRRPEISRQGELGKRNSNQEAGHADEFLSSLGFVKYPYKLSRGRARGRDGCHYRDQHFDQDFIQAELMGWNDLPQKDHVVLLE